MLTPWISQPFSIDVSFLKSVCSLIFDFIYSRVRCNFSTIKKIPLKQKLVETNQINFCFHLKKKRNETIYINWIIRPKYFLVFKYFPNVFQSVCYTISLFPNGDRFQSFACFLITLLDIWSTSKGHQTEKALMKKIDGLKRSFIFDSRQILLIRFKFIIQGCLQLSSMKTSLI